MVNRWTDRKWQLQLSMLADAVHATPAHASLVHAAALELGRLHALEAQVIAQSLERYAPHQPKIAFELGGALVAKGYTFEWSGDEREVLIRPVA